MAGTYQGFKFNYNTTAESITVSTNNVSRIPEEMTVIRQTPTGERYKQIFGNGKYRWSFAFSVTDRDLLTIFNNAYDSQSSYTLTMEEENDDLTYTEYDVIMNRPSWSTDSLNATNPTDKDLTVEVLEA